jgi:hypothetical protein
MVLLQKQPGFTALDVYYYQLSCQILIQFVNTSCNLMCEEDEEVGCLSSHFLLIALRLFMVSSLISLLHQTVFCSDWIMINLIFYSQGHKRPCGF